MAHGLLNERLANFVLAAHQLEPPAFKASHLVRLQFGECNSNHLCSTASRLEVKSREAGRRQFRLSRNTWHFMGWAGAGPWSRWELGYYYSPLPLPATAEPGART